MVQNGFAWPHRLGPAFRQGSSFFTNNFRRTVRAKLPTLLASTPDRCGAATYVSLSGKTK
jgi:hypothetical protein